MYDVPYDEEEYNAFCQLPESCNFNYPNPDVNIHWNNPVRYSIPRDLSGPYLINVMCFGK